MKNQIICLATTPWDSHFTRKQQVMSRLNDCEIAYVNPPVTMIAKYKDASAGEYAARYKNPPEKVSDNITVWNLPAILPFGNKYRFINKINQKRLAKRVKAIAAHHGFENPVIWCYSPMYADIVDLLDKSYLVYDCVDRHSAYKGFINPRVVDGMEKDLCEKCHMVFATATGLYDTLSQYNPDTYMIPNGVNFELFNKAYTEQYDIPEDMQGIKSPILGFVGFLQEWLDYGILEKLASSRPDYSLVFVGPTGAGVNLDKLRQHPNTFFLGAKPQTDLPRYIAHFSAALNPFRESLLSMDVSPLKFYEYLATGKPVVSTRQPLQVNDFADVVYIAGSADEFIACCDKAIAQNDPERVDLQLKRAKDCSWDARVKEMRKRLAEKGILV